MYINNNFGSQRDLHQALEQDIHTLNNQLQRWKMIVAQLPHPNSFPHQHPLAEISMKLDNINQRVSQFIFHFQRELHSITDKIAAGGYRVGLGIAPQQWRQQHQEQKFKLVNQKINMLEENLKKTQESEKKLIQTLNYMIKKYEDIEIQNRSRNQEYFNSTLTNSETKGASFTPFSNCSAPQQKVVQSKSKEKLFNHFNKTEAHRKNIYLLNEASFNLDYSTQSNSSHQPQEHHFRMFSQPEQKLSLRHVPKRVGLDDKESSFCRQGGSRSDKHLSLDKHEHRLRFMMNNLGQ